MTTRKKLKKMAQRRTANAQNQTARVLARSLPANTFGSVAEYREKICRTANDVFLSGEPAPGPQDRCKIVERLFLRASPLMLPDIADMMDMGVFDINPSKPVSDAIHSLYAAGAYRGIEVSIWPDAKETLFLLPDFPDTAPDTAPERLVDMFTYVYWRGYDFFHLGNDGVEDEAEYDGDY
ncbi:hypothetical protein BBC27_09590 [Acidithiobacillus ferrivorans]|uniref:Uncharacterized protein n=1 Tax=Acidithiobacillus ferrivorans TaxID=160808 RepID=A0A1B9BZE9_9PROT|nr:hypothetical protein [Acidithiobacillus ferrivorans]OCB03092.1 hypothetical protein BBC27_09590 [Acidithiobacillus ferrivorans]